MHSIKSNYQKSSFLYGRLLDLSSESYLQEYNTITDIGDVDIITAHFRNLKLLEQLGKKIIYVSFKKSHFEIIKERLERKVNNKNISKDTYEILKGADWPSWEEYKNGEQVDELNSNFVGISKFQDLEDWYYIMPTETDNLFEIKFDDILTGNIPIKDLSKYLGVEYFDIEKIEYIIKNYIKAQ